jgi:hypothetical protein
VVCSELQACGLIALAGRWSSPIQLEVDGQIERQNGLTTLSRVFDQAHGPEGCSNTLVHSVYSMSWSRSPTLSILERLASMAFSASS